MSLGKGLDRLFHRNGQEDTVGEFVRRKDGLEAQGFHAGNPDRKAVAFRTARRDGDGDALDRDWLHAFPGPARISI